MRVWLLASGLRYDIDGLGVLFFACANRFSHASLRDRNRTLFTGIETNPISSGGR